MQVISPPGHDWRNCPECIAVRVGVHFYNLMLEGLGLTGSESIICWGLNCGTPRRILPFPDMAGQLQPHYACPNCRTTLRVGIAN